MDLSSVLSALKCSDNGKGVKPNAAAAQQKEALKWLHDFAGKITSGSVSFMGYR
jgi:hypothetical protein